MDLNCLRNELTCILESVGGTADVVFKRLDKVQSAEPNIYRERRPSEKTFLTWARQVVIDEQPRRNTYGRTGGEYAMDVAFTLYDWGSYTPAIQDLVDYRGVTYEVTGITRVNPSGADDQLAYLIDAARYR